MRLLICAGGTGGGVYPALAILNALQNEYAPKTDARLNHPDHLSLLWVGGEGGMEEELVKRARLEYRSIPAAGVHGVSIKALPGNLLRLAKGYSASVRIIRRFRPQVMLFTGGYIAVPMALAGRNVPSVVYVPDIEPGLALKVLAHFADQIAVTAEISRKYYRYQARISITGYPVRAGLRPVPKDEALQTFSLSRDLPVLLVSGGSSGARSINRALIAALPDLLNEMQVIHLTGKRDWDEIKSSSADLLNKLDGNITLFKRYRAFPYLHEEISAAFSAADLALARAGASVLGELPHFGLPAILVPYPYAWRYQKENADYLVGKGAAVLLADENLSENLTASVRHLIRDGEKRNQMRRAMASIAHPEAASAIAALVVQSARKEGVKGSEP